MKKFVKLSVAAVLIAAIVLAFVPAVSVTSEAADRFVYKHVIVIGVDGMGKYHNNCDTPNMDKILKNNPNAAWTDYCLASDPNISGPCWTSMLTGVNPNLHGNTNAKVEDTNFTYNNADYPTLFKLIRQSRPDATLGCYSSWIGPANGMVEAGLDVDTLYTSYNDQTLLSKAKTYIALEQPDFFMCVFNDVDAAGHANNWGTEAYYEALTRVDGYVGELYKTVEKAGMLDDTLFIITTDHGGWTNGHGVRNDDTKYCYFGAVGKTINGNNDLDVRGRDMAAIVAYAMNVEGNPKWDSYIPQGMFTDNMTPIPAPDGNLTKKHQNAATPAVNSATGLGSFIDMDDLKMALFFDGNANDQTGNETTLEKGTVTYQEGYYGKSVGLYNGYVSVPNITFGTDSFAISLWMKKTNLESRNPWNPAICTNKPWNSGMNYGFALAEWTATTHFNVGNGSVRTDSYNAFLENTGTNWFNIIVSVDRPNNTYYVYYNFSLVTSGKFNDAFKTMTFDTGLPFNIGQDANGTYVHKTDSLFDDFLVFDGAITEAQIQGLYNYYFQDLSNSNPSTPSNPTTQPTTQTTKPSTVTTTVSTTKPAEQTTTVTTAPVDPTTEPTTAPTTEPTTAPTTAPTTEPATAPTTAATTTAAPDTTTTAPAVTDPTVAPTTQTGDGDASNGDNGMIWIIVAAAAAAAVIAAVVIILLKKKK